MSTISVVEFLLLYNMQSLRHCVQPVGLGNHGCATCALFSKKFLWKYLTHVFVCDIPSVVGVCTLRAGSFATY